MRLALSVRIAEAPRAKDRIAVPFEALAAQAAAAGFEALSMRASVLSVASPARRIAEVRRCLDGLGLGVSMVTGDLALAANDGGATRALREIGPYLDLAEALGARLVRVMLHGAADIAPARRAADLAARRGITLCQQTHWGTLFETVDQALATLAAIDRPNFALTYEPANLLACGGPWGAAAIRRLGPHLANVYFQNLCLDDASPTRFQSHHAGSVGVRFLALDDACGIDAAPLVGALGGIGYAGWLTVHQPLLAGQTVAGAIAGAAAHFRPLIAAGA